MLPDDDISSLFCDMFLHSTHTHSIYIKSFCFHLFNINIHINTKTCQTKVLVVGVNITGIMPPQVATYSVYCNDNVFLLVCIFLLCVEMQGWSVSVVQCVVTTITVMSGVYIARVRHTPHSPRQVSQWSTSSPA